MVAENLTGLSDDDFKLHVVAVANEAARRLTAKAKAVADTDDEGLIGPDAAVKELHLPNRRALYRLSPLSRPMPFDRSRSQKDRVYDLAGLKRWRARQRPAA